MNKIEKLTQTVKEFFEKKGIHYGYCEETIDQMLRSINFYALFQTICQQADTIHTYVCDGEMPVTLKYRSAELLSRKAVRVYCNDDYHIDDGVLAMTHFLELWLLDDMTMAVTSCFRTVFGEEEYFTEYREYKGTDWPDTEICMDLDDLWESITGMYPDVFDPDDVIIYEP